MIRTSKPHDYEHLFNSVPSRCGKCDEPRSHINHRLEPVSPNHNYSLRFRGKPNTGQLHVGIDAEGKAIWHTGNDFKLWSGKWGERTPGELHAECKSIIADLEAMYPSLSDEEE